MKRIVVETSQDLKDDFKAICKRLGRTEKYILNELIKKFVKKHNKTKEAR